MKAFWKNIASPGATSFSEKESKKITVNNTEFLTDWFVNGVLQGREKMKVKLSKIVCMYYWAIIKSL